MNEVDLNEEVQLKAQIRARRDEITTRWEKDNRQAPRIVAAIIVILAVSFVGISLLVQSALVAILLIFMIPMVGTVMAKAMRKDRRLFQEWLDNPEPTDPRIWEIATKTLYLIDTPQKERTKHANTLMLLIAIPIFGMAMGGIAAIFLLNGFWPDTPQMIRSIGAPVGLLGGALIGIYAQRRIANRLSDQ